MKQVRPCNFAGGLKKAMSELASVSVWLALVAFSLGVELGHQVVVAPTVFGPRCCQEIAHWSSASGAE